MTKPSNSPPFPATAFCCLLAFLAPAVGIAEKTVARTVPATANVSVSVECLTGQLRFLGGGGRELSVTGTIGDDAELTIRGKGSEIDIEVDVPDRRRGKVLVNANLEIRLPSGASLEIETLSANTEIEDVGGEIEIETLSANATIVRSSGPVSVETVSGKIRVLDAEGDIEVETVSGIVEIEQMRGSLEVSAVNGRVEVRDAELSGGDLESVNASLFLQARLAPESRLSIESYSGNVELVLPSSTSASFEIETLSGKIDNQLSSDQPRRPERFAPGQMLEATLGSGSARVTIETLSGNVVIRP